MIRIKAVTALVVGLLMGAITSLLLGNLLNNKGVLQDIPYAESDDALSVNPGRGFYSTVRIALDEGGRAGSYTLPKPGTGSLLHVTIDLSALSGNMNATGEDAGLTPEAVAAVRSLLSDIRESNMTAIIRVTYDGGAPDIIGGKARLEPSLDTMIGHIRQLCGVFREYASTVELIQVGFFGLWGECYYNTDIGRRLGDYNRVVEELLSATDGTDIQVALRTPARIIGYYEYGGAGADRLCLFNDGYGGSYTDLGTYSDGTDRDYYIRYLGDRGQYYHYGGEVVVDRDYDDGIGAYNDPAYFIDEARRMRTSYLNGEWDGRVHNAWRDSAADGADSALDYIAGRLGYRLVLRESRLSGKVMPGGKISVSLLIENVGFGNIIKGKRADIIAIRGDGSIAAEYEGVPIDAKALTAYYDSGKAGRPVRRRFDIVARGLQPGEYRLYLRISSGEKLRSGGYYSPIRLANDYIWDDTLQANYIGKISVVES